MSVRDEGSYKVRTLSLRQVVTKKSRVICHLHFTDWPDNRVPEDPKSFLGKKVVIYYEGSIVVGNNHK